MNEIITEKKYPIRNIWLFKQILVPLIILIIYFILFFSSFGDEISGASASVLFISLLIVLFMIVLMHGILVIINMLRRSNFHYSFEEKFMVFHQGIISKQNKNVPYGVIQGVFVNQGLFERIFGLSALTIENFSQGGRSALALGALEASGFVKSRFSSGSRNEMLGFMGNKIHIPGLKKKDAEELKAIILQRVKENPIEDSQSGL